MKENLKSLKNRFHNKKGMNTIETVIIIMILLLCILTMLDLMEITQKMSSTTSAVNYVTRLVGRQGGISNGEPEGFSNYGHGSYVTSNSACSILNQSLRKAFSKKGDMSVLGEDVRIYIETYELNRGDGKYYKKSGSRIELKEDSEFGVYIPSSNISDNLLIRQDDVLFHQVYYLVVAEMYYPAFTVQKLITFSDSYFTESEEYLRYKKQFTRFIIPTYYNRNYLNNGDYSNSASEWYVK